MIKQQCHVNTAIPVSGAIPLNKHIAKAGVCSRRKAAELVQPGYIRVNGAIIRDPGFRITATDRILYQKRPLIVDRPVYLVLNKPRRAITSCADDQGRKTVMDLLPEKLRYGLFPVGRLDTETTGLLLITNDGDLAQKMSHPRYAVQKVYHVILDRPLPEEILAQIARGIRLADGMIKVDFIEYASESDMSSVRIALHSGKNLIIKRIFKQFSFWVKKLDRVAYAGLTTRGLASGEWRFLTNYEIRSLKKK
jgi:23S rRNA pseudouridine2605 synthase